MYTYMCIHSDSRFIVFYSQYLDSFHISTKGPTPLLFYCCIVFLQYIDPSLFNQSLFDEVFVSVFLVVVVVIKKYYKIILAQIFLNLYENILKENSYK